MGRANPKKPYKMYAAIVAAVASYLVAQTTLSLPPVAVVSLQILVVGLSVYGVRNPEVDDNYDESGSHSPKVGG